VSWRAQIHEAAARKDVDALCAIVQNDRRALRHLVGLTYRDDVQVREAAARAIARAARHHKKQVIEVIERLVWAMEARSNTNATFAPQVLRAIADESPELLLPVVVDLTRLCRDSSLRPALGDTLRAVTSRCRGEVGKRLALDLNDRGFSIGACSVDV
jgi:hypothetical protein